MNFTKFYDEIDFDAKSRFISKTKATEGDIRSRGFFVRVLQGSQQADLTGSTMEGHFLSARRKKASVKATIDGGRFLITIPDEVFDAGGTALGELVLFGSAGEEIASDTFEIKVSDSIRYATEEDEGGTTGRDFQLLVDRVDSLEKRVKKLEEEPGGLTEEEVKAVKVTLAAESEYAWNAARVNQKTVEKDVPADANFEDTIYDDTEIRSLIGNVDELLDTINGEVI